jgi:tRNA G10  N-methylase Trm11
VNNYNYFYKLGHQPLLGYNEYLFLTNQSFESAADNGPISYSWFLGQHSIDVNQTGSLVFGGQILAHMSRSEFFSLESRADFITTSLTNFAPENGFKQIGISLEKEIGRDRLFETLKNSGYKKINLLSGGQLPNFGHFKHTKNWFVFFSIHDQFYFGKLTSFADQEFWSKLDMRLPKLDMRRGIINLKLGRTLLNFTSKETIWDPFCGQGRVLISGGDLKKEFLASDIDEVCISDTKENYEEACKSWYTRSKRQFPDKEPFLPPLDVFPLDAQNLTQIQNIRPDIDCKKIAIVTEGYLGTNYNHTPTEQEIIKQFNHLEMLWSKVLSQAQTLKIPEIIFCLPSYEINKKLYPPNFLPKILKGLSYKQVPFSNGKNDIMYSRPDSFVKHTIIKLVYN